MPQGDQNHEEIGENDELIMKNGGKMYLAMKNGGKT